MLVPSWLDNFGFLGGSRFPEQVAPSTKSRTLVQMVAVGQKRRVVSCRVVGRSTARRNRPVEIPLPRVRVQQ